MLLDDSVHSAARMNHPSDTHFAPAKINLFLEIVGKRADGFHEIETVMVPIDLGDRLRVSDAPELTVVANRPDVPSGEANLAHRIVRAAESVLGRPLPARIEIEKHLPPGSGLGAGSSDAAAALRAVLALHSLEVPVEIQESIAARVGSDTAFFVRGKPALCNGRGEQVRPIVAPQPLWLVLVLGAPPAPTKEVYAALRHEGPRRESGPLREVLSRGELPPDDLIFNRLESAAFVRFPELRRIADRLHAVAGRPAHLSGSGSAFYLLADHVKEAAILAETIRRQTELDALIASTIASEETI